MIKRLRLRNWRSYDDLDLELDPGTSFVVAPNGVGKTSLVLGLAWGVFGQHSAVEPRSCIRAGAEDADVQVEFELPVGRHFKVSRTVRRRGAHTATYEMNGARLTESSAIIEMERALKVELPVAGRLSMMLGGGHIAAHDTLNLENHLHHAFGIAHLLDAARFAQSVAREAEKARAALRTTTRQRMADRATLENEIIGLEAKSADLMERNVELEHLRNAASAQRSLVERHLALTSQMERYEQQRSHLLSTIEDLLARSVVSESNETLSAELHAELNECEADISVLTEGVVSARSVITAADQAVKLLEEDHAVCPTCLRSLPHQQREQAVSRHRAQRTEAQSEAQRIEVARREKQTYAGDLSRLLAQLEAMTPPRVDTEHDNVPSRTVVDAMYDEVITALDENNRELGAVQSRLNSLRAQIASDDQLQQEENEVHLAYRREAAALAGARALRQAADHMIESRIAPMAHEVRGRWKHLFANNGLTFRPDGSITRLRGGEELAWDTLSGGERTWARIVTHLIVMSVTTSLPFAWFDEPLEHLDPQLRHAVAATLATATRGGSPRQLLVTTYEHAIAQQLANETEDASIIAIREAGDAVGLH